MSVATLEAASDLSIEDWARFDTAGDPFVSREFLGTFENFSRGEAAVDVHPALRWQPAHLVLRDMAGTAVGMVPTYRRWHSFGDFSRDWGWPDAWHRAGLAYYPKRVTGVPYTPSPGPRLLVSRGLAPAAALAARESLVGAAIDAARSSGDASWQCLFVDPSDRDVLRAAGCLLRRGVQFHWSHRGYRDFDDFLAIFRADKRKKLKRERRAVAEAGLTLRALHGREIDAATWRTIHAQYRNTFERHGNLPALPLRFFVEVAAALDDRLVVFCAHDADGSLVASAICYRDDTTLYGRHWGCARTVPGLHFELCYYQGIDYCLRHGLQRFEPGAQGEHKLARGFEPADTWSAFWIADPRLRAAVAGFLAREDAAMRDYADETATHLPFRANALPGA